MHKVVCGLVQSVKCVEQSLARTEHSISDCDQYYYFNIIMISATDVLPNSLRFSGSQGASPRNVLECSHFIPYPLGVL